MLTYPEAQLKVLKKGILPILALYKDHPLTSWTLFKKLTTLWCSENEKLRISAVMAMFRLLKGFNSDYQEKALKVNNSFFFS